jgi:hypothetical protein
VGTPPLIKIINSCRCITQVDSYDSLQKWVQESLSNYKPHVMTSISMGYTHSKTIYPFNFHFETDEEMRTH